MRCVLKASQCASDVARVLDLDASVHDDRHAARLGDVRALIRSIVWATGFRPDYSWLDVPVIDEKGYLRHEGGVVDAPGMYALGLPVLQRRNSTFIAGAGDDARDVIPHLAGYLARPIDASR